MSVKINIKVPKELAEKVRDAAKAKFRLRDIEHYSEAVREVLILFVKENGGGKE